MFWVIIVDDCTDCSWNFFMKSKDQLNTKKVELVEDLNEKGRFFKITRYSHLYQQMRVLLEPFLTYGLWSCYLLVSSNHQDGMIIWTYSIPWMSLELTSWKISGTWQSWYPCISVCICILPYFLGIQLYIDFEHQCQVECDNSTYISSLLKQS
jgi:hypothetical protein